MKRRKSTAQEAAPAAPAPLSQLQQFQLAAGYAVVALAVAGGGVMFLFPRAFGLAGVNPAPLVGLGVLALFRMAALHWEVRRQSSSAPPIQERPLRRDKPGGRRR